MEGRKIGICIAHHNDQPKLAATNKIKIVLTTICIEMSADVVRCRIAKGVTADVGLPVSLIYPNVVDKHLRGELLR